MMRRARQVPISNEVVGQHRSNTSLGPGHCQPVTITVERERSALASYGHPADRNVYVTTWDDPGDDLQIDDTPTSPSAGVKGMRVSS